jgi:hypothetical protein
MSYSLFLLAQLGTQVVVANRDPDEARPLKVTGDLGQIIPLVSPHPTRLATIFTPPPFSCRNSIYETRNRSMNAYATLILSSTLLVVIMKPSKYIKEEACAGR